MQKRPEVLAPAGSMEALKAAIAAGCDAVYIGGKQFGARAYADNPDEDHMIEAIDYCHLHGVKVYLTVNTLLKEWERNELLYDYLKPYYEAGLDAVIVQDVGVLQMVRRCFPSLAVHASTQMTLTMGKGTQLFQEYHVNRIVPARELSLEELRQMRKDTDAELEVFVHGALCYCYSGQCLFSSMLGGRSGNRGRCAQPCRMPYQLDGKQSDIGEYLLSPKELCNLKYVGEMIEAGIDSFKIEGRMKRPEYTAFVTAIYRKYVDRYMELGKARFDRFLKEHQEEYWEDERLLSELYNRNGFTSGYLEAGVGSMEERHAGKKGEMLASVRPRHGGVLVGTVVSSGKREVVYKTEREILSQDVVEFRDHKGRQIYEYTLGNKVQEGEHVTAKIGKGCEIAVGTKVYRTKNASLLESIRNEYMVKPLQQAVRGCFKAKIGKPISLQVNWGDWTVSVTGGICELAKKQQTTEEMVKKILTKTGNSEYYFTSLEVVLEDNIFLSVGMIKNLRRKAFQKLQEMVLSQYRRTDVVSYEKENGVECLKHQVERMDSVKKGIYSASVVRKAQLEPVLYDDRIQKIYLHTELLDDKELTQAAHKIKEEGKQAWLVMPAIFRKGIWKLFEKKQELFEAGWDGYLIKNFESFHFLTSLKGIERDKIALDYNMYVMNEGAAAFWKEQEVVRYTLPVELTKQELEKLSFISETEMIIYGKIPVMTSAQCIMANTTGCSLGDGDKWGCIHKIEDSKKRGFYAVNYCKYCYNIIYEQEPVYLEDEVKKNSKFDVVGKRFCFTVESAEEIREILKGTFQEKTNRGHYELGVE